MENNVTVNDNKAAWRNDLRRMLIEHSKVCDMYGKTQKDVLESLRIWEKYLHEYSVAQIEAALMMVAVKKSGKFPTPPEVLLQLSPKMQEESEAYLKREELTVYSAIAKKPYEERTDKESKFCANFEAGVLKRKEQNEPKKLEDPDIVKFNAIMKKVSLSYSEAIWLENISKNDSRFSYLTPAQKLAIRNAKYKHEREHMSKEEIEIADELHKELIQL